MKTKPERNRYSESESEWLEMDEMRFRFLSCSRNVVFFVRRFSVSSAINHITSVCCMCAPLSGRLHMNYTRTKTKNCSSAFCSMWIWFFYKFHLEFSLIDRFLSIYRWCVPFSLSTSRIHINFVFVADAVSSCDILKGNIHSHNPLDITSATGNEEKKEEKIENETTTLHPIGIDGWWMCSVHSWSDNNLYWFVGWIERKGEWTNKEPSEMNE